MSAVGVCTTILLEHFSGAVCGFDVKLAVADVRDSLVVPGCTYVYGHQGDHYTSPYGDDSVKILIKTLQSVTLKRRRGRIG